MNRSYVVDHTERGWTFGGSLQIAELRRTRGIRARRVALRYPNEVHLRRRRGAFQECLPSS